MLAEKIKQQQCQCIDIKKFPVTYRNANITDIASSVYTRFSTAFIRSFKPLHLTFYFIYFYFFTL